MDRRVRRARLVPPLHPLDGEVLADRLAGRRGDLVSRSCWARPRRSARPIDKRFLALPATLIVQRVGALARAVRRRAALDAGDDAGAGPDAARSPGSAARSACPPGWPSPAARSARSLRTGRGRGAALARRRWSSVALLGVSPRRATTVRPLRRRRGPGRRPPADPLGEHRLLGGVRPPHAGVDQDRGNRSTSSCGRRTSSTSTTTTGRTAQTQLQALAQAPRRHGRGRHRRGRRRRRPLHQRRRRDRPRRHGGRPVREGPARAVRRVRPAAQPARPDRARRPPAEGPGARHRAERAAHRGRAAWAS